MKKIDWVTKLTSRKLWAAISSFASLIIIAMGGSEVAALQASALIMAGGAVIACIIGNGLVDPSDVSNPPTVDEEKD